jgi:hypothetical protein
MDAMFAPLAPEEATVAEQAPKTAGKTPIIPVPADAPAMRFKHPQRGEPSRCWPYHDAEARLVGYVCRWDFTDADGVPTKEILPVTYCDLGKGKRAWRSKGIPSPRPLFGLPDIFAQPDATVMIVEGEKTRDAAAALFPDMVVTTPAHGAKSPRKTDVSPLTGRTVVVATDNDAPGESYGDIVYELACTAGAKEVLHLRPDRLGAWLWRDGAKVLRGDPLSDGWDLADAVDDGWTAERVAELRSDPGFIIPYRDAQERADIAAGLSGERADDERFTGWPFRVTHEGVEKRIERADKETGAITVEWKWFASRLEIEAETRSTEGEDWGRLLRVTDRDGFVKSWAMPMAMLAGDGVAYRERLLSPGMIMAPGKFARDALHEYVSTARPKAKARCVARTGWQSKAYVGVDENFGEGDHG